MKKELTNYIEEQILIQYLKNEEGHGISHINTVLERSLKLSEGYEVDKNKVYVIASYHDLGHHINKDIHEKISADILRSDENLRKWFDENEIELMAQAVEDHRASLECEPRSIYGKIISSADRTILNFDDIVKRSYSYGKKHYSEYNDEEQIERIYNHLVNKYSEKGYAKFYLTDDEFDNALEQLRSLLNDKNKFIERARMIVLNFEKTKDKE